MVSLPLYVVNVLLFMLYTGAIFTMIDFGRLSTLESVVLWTLYGTAFLSVLILTISLIVFGKLKNR